MFRRSSPDIVRVVLSAMAVAASLALGQPARPTDVQGDAPLITSIEQYWQLPAEQKTHPLLFRIECDVTYFDAGWRMLFIQDTRGLGAYVPYGDNPFPFKPGRHITATGTFVPPNADISFEHATITEQGPSHIVPIPIAGRVTQFQQFAARFVTCEGLVDHYRRLDPTHMQLTLSIDGEAVFAWVQLEANDEMPDLGNMNVRLEGVYNSKIGPDGRLSSLEILVPGLKHFAVASRLEDDTRFQTPVVPIDSLPRLPSDRLVHVIGQVKAQEPGRYMRIRDDSGQVDVLTGQTTLCAINTLVDAVGYPAINGTEWQLRGGLFRLDRNPAPAPAARPAVATLRLAEQVHELSAPEALSGLPVWLTGVVTWSDPNSPFFFIQDSSSGICVMRGQSTSQLRGPGRNVEVHGVTSMGQFAPVVIASRFDKVSDLVLPQARQVSLEHAMTGAEVANWVEMRGYLRQIRRREAWNDLEVVTSTGDFIAVLPASADVSSMVGAVIRLYGVCTAKANAQRKLTGIVLYVPGAAYVQVEEPAPEDPFALPARSLGSLGQYDTLLSNNRRLKVIGRGAALLARAPYSYRGRRADAPGSSPAAVLRSSPATGLKPSDFPGRQGGRLVLRESVFRKTGRDRQPDPVRIEPRQDPVPDLDGQLVSIEGSLIDTSPAGGQSRLSLQAGNLIFEALLEDVAGRPRPELPAVGSVLLLTGVYELKFDEYGQPVAFQLRLRGPADVAVLMRPSWLTRGRIMALSGVLVAGILLFIAWVAALRRRVRAADRPDSRAAETRGAPRGRTDAHKQARVARHSRGRHCA